MEPYIELVGTLQNSGFWLVKVRPKGPTAVFRWLSSRQVASITRCLQVALEVCMPA